MIQAVELAAVVASALYGVLRGLRANFDVVGLVSVAAAAAFGGGTLRDVLLDRRPLFWVQNEHLLWIVLAVAVIGAIAPRKIAQLECILPLPDALGLGLFSVAGTAVAIDAGMTPVVSVVMGVITGSFGGVICDMICNETPSLFRSSPLYATCAMAGGVAYVSLHPLVAVDWLPFAAGFFTAAGLRIVALWRDWRVPIRALDDPSS